MYYYSTQSKTVLISNEVDSIRFIAATPATKCVQSTQSEDESRLVVVGGTFHLPRSLWKWHRCSSCWFWNALSTIIYSWKKLVQILSRWYSGNWKQQWNWLHKFQRQVKRWYIHIQMEVWFFDSWNRIWCQSTINVWCIILCTTILHNRNCIDFERSSLY